MNDIRILLRANALVLFLASAAAAQLPNGFFTDVKRVPGVNSSSVEWSMTISPDNKTLYFASDRSGGEGDNDLYQATRESVTDGWSNVINLGTGINTATYEANPTVTEDGRTLYFSSDRDGGEGSFDIYVATRNSTSEQFGNVQSLGTSINSKFDDGGQTLPSGELSIFYNVRNRDGGFGGYDLYTAVRTSDMGSFEPSINLGLDVNTERPEASRSYFNEKSRFCRPRRSLLAPVLQCGVFQLQAIDIDGDREKARSTAHCRPPYDPHRREICRFPTNAKKRSIPTRLNPGAVIGVISSIAQKAMHQHGPLCFSRTRVYREKLYGHKNQVI